MTSRLFFRPLLVPTLITLPMLVGLLLLGSWQTQRAGWKDNLIETLTSRMDTPIPFPPSTTWSDQPLENLTYYQVRLTGQFDHQKERHVYRTYKGQQGYRIVTPFILQAGGTVMIDRGFVPTHLKDPASRLASKTNGMLTVRGLLRPLEKRGFFDPPHEPDNNIWFARDTAMARTATMQYPMAPFFVSLLPRPNAKGLYPYPTEPYINLTQRHRAYAITWYSLAIALVILYITYHKTKGRCGLTKAP